MTEPKPPIVLASASPRRHELMTMLALPFVVESADIDESVQGREAPADYVQRLSREKAEAGAARHPGGMVIAADTIVVHLGEILGKPRDAAHAREMLQRLRGETHRALTGVSVLDSVTGKTLTDLCDSKVTLRDMSDEEIDAYIASGEPMDKAAAYGIQNLEVAPVEQVVGCPANVMGLPLCHVIRSLRRQGVELPPSPPTECRVQYGYYCTIAEEVMPGLTDKP